MSYSFEAVTLSFRSPACYAAKGQRPIATNSVKERGRVNPQVAITYPSPSTRLHALNYWLSAIDFAQPTQPLPQAACPAHPHSRRGLSRNQPRGEAQYRRPLDGKSVGLCGCCLFPACIVRFAQPHQRSRRMRKRSSTSAITSCDNRPHREISRSLDTDRIASHRITQSFLVPPSPLLTFTCKGMSRWVEVSGKTTIKSAGPALKKSTERTSTGLRPVCSRPRIERRSASQISPRCG